MGVLYVMVFVSLTLSAAIFGFFYAWICSTIWGLDQINPRVAIEAMQAMNASVRNAVFAPAFFGTGPALLVTAVLSFTTQHKTAALFFALAGITYILGAMVLTMVVHVPMNEALAALGTPPAEPEAAAIWADYSPRWHFWNIVRTIASWAALMLAAVAVFNLRSGPVVP